VTTDLSSFSRARIGGHDEEMSFFDHDGRRYFSVAYHASGSPFALVVVHPFGFEHATLHPLEVMVARALADRGVPGFYLHSQGYGDSGGAFADVSLATHVRDAGVAIDRALSLFGVDQVVLAGARYGASVALLAAQERSDRVRAVAAWHPLVRGKPWFDAMLRSAAVGALAEGGGVGPKALRRRMDEEGWLDLHGYPVFKAQFEEGVAFDLTDRLRMGPRKVLLTQVTRPGKADPDIEKLNAKLEELGSTVTPGTVALQPGKDFALPVPHAVTPVVMKPAFDQVTQMTVRWVGE
jgi:pimeloyl-ACP methyl ester carboxylesterase